MPPLLINGACAIDRPTGVTTYISQIVPHLRDLGPTFLGNRSFLGSCSSLSVPHHPIPPRLSPDFGARGHLRRLLWTQFQLPPLMEQFQASLLFSPVPEAPLGCYYRYAVMLHDAIPLRFPNWRSPLTYYARYYVPRVLAGAAKILCNSQATARDAVEFFGVAPHKLAPVWLACDRQRFRPNPAAKQGNYFLAIGRLFPYKNLARAIAALARVPDSECELWIAGPPDGRYLPGLQARARAEGVEHRVRFLGYVASETLPALLQEAIALVFVSLWEGFGLPLLEAMACGTPAIVSNLSALPEVAGDAALVVDPRNIQAIAAAMAQILADGTARSHLQVAGLARVREFSWERTGRATAAILADLL